MEILLGELFGSLVDHEAMEKYLPKIKLMTFDGKEPRVWVRKCIKLHGVPLSLITDGNS